MLDPETLRQVQASLPTFKTHSHAIATSLYTHLFAANPSLKTLFSREFLSLPCPHAHHALPSQISAQAQILADSILHFCAHASDPGALDPVLARICAKHVSRRVRPAHYSAVAAAFSAAVRDVIGDRVSNGELDAWDTAVTFLSGLLIEREKAMYTALHATPGAWEGFRTFQVSQMDLDPGLAGVCVKLVPKNAAPVAEYMSGQYVCLRAHTEDYGQVHRNTALSPRLDVDATNGAELSAYEIRLALPAKPAVAGDCRVSTDAILYDHLRAGGEVELSAPVGGFVPQTKRGHGKGALDGGGILRAAVAAKVAGRGGGRMAALKGARSPLAEVVGNAPGRGRIASLLGGQSPLQRGGSPLRGRRSPLAEAAGNGGRGIADAMRGDRSLLEEVPTNEVVDGVAGLLVTQVGDKGNVESRHA